MEGVAFSLKDCLGGVEKMGLPINEMRVVGGGAKSPLWRSILSDVFDRPLIKVKNDDASFGAAMLAGIGIGVFKDFQDSVERCVRMESKVSPDAERAQQYRKLFEIYRKIHDDLANTYKWLAQSRSYPV